MSQYIITGGKPLQGNVVISGRKNAALKLIAATILTSGKTIIKRVPDIGDVSTMLDILRAMGAEINQTEPQTYSINTGPISLPVIPNDLGRKLRASLVLVGPLLARFGEVTFPHPGGCIIGKRSIAPHLEAFSQLGAAINFDGQTYHLKADNLNGTDIYLKERSVTGTENLIMAATRSQGITNIYNAAEEPHIGNLGRLLIKFGYQIQGLGTSKITVYGQSQLASLDAEETVIADDVEVGTFAVAGAITRGNVRLEEVGTKEELNPILAKLDDFQVNYRYDASAQVLDILPSPDLSGANLQTAPWPGFPSDLQSPFTILATQAKGTSLIHDWMFEGRLYFASSLQSMGANIVICDPHRVLVSGPTPLNRSALITPDLRAGAAMVLAALAAEGTSVIEHAELIERGYSSLDQRLACLGADITRKD